jgi:Cu-processing system permease protein
MNALFTIARLEFIGAVRLKWIRLLTAAFALLAAAAAYAAGANGDLQGADGFARTTMTLVPVVLILVPLAAVILGVSGQATESGGEPFLFAQPVGRATVLLGRWAGELAALGGSIVAGFGAGAWIVATSAGTDGLVPYAFFVAMTVTLAAIFLSLAATIAAATRSRASALGVATFVWFFFVLLYDGLALAIAGQATGAAGGRLLFGSVFGNPTDLIRLVMLFASGTPNALGAPGEAWTRFLGGDARAAVVAAIALSLWTMAPLGLAAAGLRRRDL